jgi:hypothetical protein
MRHGRLARRCTPYASLAYDVAAQQGLEDQLELDSDNDERERRSPSARGGATTTAWSRAAPMAPTQPVGV